MLWLSAHLFQTIQILPVNAHDSGRVLRPLHSSFNLQRCNPCPDNLRKQFKRTQILHAQKVFLAAKHVSLPVFPSERKPTWLRTASPVAAPASDHAAEKALSGIAIAKRTMYKGLDLDPVSSMICCTRPATVPRRDDSCDAVPLQYTHTVTAGNRPCVLACTGSLENALPDTAPRQNPAQSLHPALPDNMKTDRSTAPVPAFPPF